jgi:hypothetical protein
MFSTLLEYAQGNKMDSQDMFAQIFRPNGLDKFAIDTETARVAGRIYSALYIAEAARVANTKEVIDTEKLAQQSITAAKAYADGLVSRHVL